jgi:hypothetical protein
MKSINSFLFVLYTMILLALIYSCAKSDSGFAPGVITFPSTGPGSAINRNCQEVLSANASSSSGVYSISYDASGCVVGLLRWFRCLWRPIGFKFYE